MIGTDGLVPIPRRILDELMPTLKDTELRVLLLVARQTIGRISKDGRASKDADWLSHSQLKTRTGRASEAVSAAVDTLIRSGLLEVFTPEGKAMASPKERQAHRGILLYRIASGVRDSSSWVLDPSSGKAKTQNAKAKITDTREFNTRNFRYPKSCQGDVPERQTREIEAQKQQIRERLGRITANHSQTTTNHSTITTSHLARKSW